MAIAKPDSSLSSKLDKYTVKRQLSSLIIAKDKQISG